MANYIDLGYYLGLRKLAGLRSVTPSIEYMEGTDTVFFVQQDKQIYLTGCEMSALQADCIKISYKANLSDSYTVIKNYVSQTVFNVTNTYDDTNNTNLISVKISATPVMNKRKFGNENSFRYSYQGSTILEEYDTYTGATDNLSITGNAEQDPIGVNNYNFSRSFIFKTPGYYKIELDEAQSALYKTTSTNTILTNPDAQSDYNSYKSSTTGPWTPVDHASHQNGNFFKRQIIVKCVNNYDAILQSNIVTEINEFTGSPPPQTQTVYIPSSAADRRKISVKDLLINGQTYGSNQYEKYCIETNGLSTATFNASDKQITTNSSTYKILRNSIFSDIIFNGSGITNLVKIESTGGIITTVDMRNTLFKNCIFKGIVFGSKNYNQLILDGSTFESCEFINCKFYIRPKNILFKNCNINNTGNYAPIFNINGSDGNVFIDLIFNNVDRPFVFDNGDNKNNLNNLFYRVFSTDSPSATNRCSFVKVMQSNSTPGVFVGNIAMMNCIVAVGDPIVIESSASLNLFTMNYFESNGSVKLGKQ
jgi:uncharacterized protein YjbI with pentapeptide repeats